MQRAACSKRASARKAGPTRGNSSAAAGLAAFQGGARRCSRTTMMPATAGARPSSPARTMRVTVAASVPASNAMNKAASSSVDIAMSARPWRRPSSHGYTKTPRSTIRMIVMGPDRAVGIVIKDRTRPGPGSAEIVCPACLFAAGEQAYRELPIGPTGLEVHVALSGPESDGAPSRHGNAACGAARDRLKVAKRSTPKVLPASNDSANPDLCALAAEAAGGGNCRHHRMRWCCSGATGERLSIAPHRTWVAACDANADDRAADLREFHQPGVSCR